MALEVRNNAEWSRYEILVDGRLGGVAEYQVGEGSVHIPHTEVDASLRGRGLAAELVGWALDDIRRSGRTVVAGCWYVARYIDDHPEYRDLLA